MRLGVSLIEAENGGNVGAALDAWSTDAAFTPAASMLWVRLASSTGRAFPNIAPMTARAIEPVITMESVSATSQWEKYGYEAILRGEHDAFLEAWGLAAKRTGQRIVVRLDQEMNGSWAPWSKMMANPAQYKAVFRYVSHRIRIVAGARNVKMWYCPIRRGRWRQDEIKAYFPGDDACQRVGFDAYSRGNNGTIAEDWDATTRTLKRISDRPIWVGEFGRQRKTGNRSAWLKGLRDVRGVSTALLFDIDLGPGHDWGLTRSLRRTYGMLGKELA